MIFIDFFANNYLTISGSLLKDEEIIIIDFMNQSKYNKKFLKLLFEKIRENDITIVGYNLFNSLHNIKKILKDEHIYEKFIDIKYLNKIFRVNDEVIDNKFMNDLIDPFKKLHSNKFNEIYLPKFVIHKITVNNIRRIKDFYEKIPQKNIKLYEDYQPNIYKIFDNCSYFSKQKIYFDDDLITIFNEKNIPIYGKEKNYFYNKYDVYGTQTGRYIYTTFNFPKKFKQKLKSENGELQSIDYNAFELSIVLNLIGFDFENIQNDVYGFFKGLAESRDSFKIKIISLLYNNEIIDDGDDENINNILKFKKFIINKYKKDGILLNVFGRPLMLEKDDDIYKIFSHYIQSSANDLMMNIVYDLRNYDKNLQIKECQYDSILLDTDEENMKKTYEFMKKFENFKLFPTIKTKRKNNE